MPDNLFKRGGTWYARVQVAGKDRRRSLFTGDLAQARRRVKEIMVEVEHARFHGEARHRWSDAVKRWAAEHLPGLAPGTAMRYRISLGQVEAMLIDLYVDQITTRTIAKVASRPGASNATRRRDLTAVSSVLRCCVAWGWLEANPARSYDRGSIPERREAIREPTDAEVEALIAACPGMLAELVRFLAETGCREEEAASLELAQLRLERGEATFLKTKTRRPRTIRLVNAASPGGLTGTKAGTCLYLGKPFVFWHGAGDRYWNVASRLAHIIRRLAKAQKIKRFRVHDLRHRFAIRWLRAGGDIYELSRHLGHTSVRTTEIYLGHARAGLAQIPAQQRVVTAGDLGLG